MNPPNPSARPLDGRLAIVTGASRGIVRLDEIHFHPMGQKAES